MTIIYKYSKLSNAESIFTEQNFRSRQYSILDKFYSPSTDSQEFENFSDSDRFPSYTEPYNLV